jgi:aminomethyltransferase
MSESSAPLTTPLYDWHKAHGGRIVEFGGWLMPVSYTSIIDEHHAVRRHVGLFDISHMGRLAFHGPEALAWLELVTTNHVARLTPGQVQYSLVLNDSGGLIDDILVYRELEPDHYAVVCNASNRQAVVARLLANRPSTGVEFEDLTRATAMIAVQGPAAVDVVSGLVDTPVADLRYYTFKKGHVAGVPATISRTGYTGEDGFELIVPAAAATTLWETLMTAGQSSGIKPCGLGARDTLRFEAAMPLYGHELNAELSPYESGVAWAVKLKKGDFLGRNALVERGSTPEKVRVGLALDGKRIARQGAEVLSEGLPVGIVTSGTFAPTLERSLAMAIVDRAVSQPGASLQVDVRGTSEPATVVPLTFYRRPTA